MSDKNGEVIILSDNYRFDVEHPIWCVYTRYIFQFLREEIGQNQRFSLLYQKLLSDQVSAYIAEISLYKNMN
jgi:hypothetical protein